MYNDTFGDKPPIAAIRHVKSATLATATAGHQPEALNAHAGSSAVPPSARSGSSHEFSGSDPVQHSADLGLHSYLHIPQLLSTAQQAPNLHSQQGAAADKSLCQSSSQATADSQLYHHQPAEGLWQHGGASAVPPSSSRLDKLQPQGLPATECKKQPAHLLLPDVRQQMHASLVPDMPSHTQKCTQGNLQVRGNKRRIGWACIRSHCKFSQIQPCLEQSLDALQSCVMMNPRNTACSKCCAGALSGPALPYRSHACEEQQRIQSAEAC